MCIICEVVEIKKSMVKIRSRRGARKIDSSGRSSIEPEKSKLYVPLEICIRVFLTPILFSFRVNNSERKI
jgi:hypothetical protein